MIFKSIISSFTLLFFYQVCFAQQKSATEFQEELNLQFKTEGESPLTEKQFNSFTDLPFFKIDSAFIFKAKFTRSVESKPFEMKTTTDRLPIYEKYGIVEFQFGGENYVLNIYQNHKLRETKEYKDYLFLPFTDNTNGNQTYGGGRFLDLKIPDSEEILIDFNQAYNPYCAYNHSYSCPIPPKENYIDFEVKAGVMYESDSE